MQSLTQRGRFAGIAAAAIVLTAALTLSACSGTSSGTSGGSAPASSSAWASATSDQGTWPRTIKTDAGEVKIEKKPMKIVSTSPTLTGTILAMGAPLKATAGAEQSAVVDQSGFFSQWADEAKKKNVDLMYTKVDSPDLEKIISEEPDLIIGSNIGLDSTKKQYQELSKIAPTVLLNYGDASWQDLAKTIGEATGMESAADKTVSDYDSFVKDAAGKITIPEQPANVMVFNGAKPSSIFTKASPQARVLEDLGFQIAEAPEQYDTNNPKRVDMAKVTQENLPSSLTGKLVFLASATDKTVDQFTDLAVLANLDAVQNKHVYALGSDTFRLDPYSSRDMVNMVVKELGK